MALGDFTASNLVGPVHLSGRSRDVTIGDFTNDLEVVIADRGDINLRPGILPLPKIDVQTRSGNITLSLPGAAKFDLTATTVHGDVTNDFGSPLKAQNDGRGATLRGSTGGGPSISLRSERGPITVRRSSAEDKPLMDKPAMEPREIKPPASTKPLKKIEQ